MNLETTLQILPQTLSPSDRDLLERAYNLAAKAHRGQKRATGEPYVNHCVAVGKILAELAAPIPVVAAGAPPAARGKTRGRAGSSWPRRPCARRFWPWATTCGWC